MLKVRIILFLMGWFYDKVNTEIEKKKGVLLTYF